MLSLVISYSGAAGSSFLAAAGAAAAACLSCCWAGSPPQPTRLKASVLTRASSITLLNIELLLTNSHIGDKRLIAIVRERDSPRYRRRIIYQNVQQNSV